MPVPDACFFSFVSLSAPPSMKLLKENLCARSARKTQPARQTTEPQRLTQTLPVQVESDLW